MVDVVIKLSNVLAGEVGGNRVHVEALTLKQALDSLLSGRDGLREKLVDGLGNPKEYINIYVDGRDYRFLSGLETPLKDGSSIQIIPAVSGG